MAVKPLTDKEMQARFGYALNFFKSDPSLKALYEKAKKGRWDQTNFQAGLRQTDWYKKRTEAQRTFDSLYYKDAASYKDNIADQRALLLKQAEALGIDTTSSAFKTWLDGTPAKGKQKAVLGAAANNVRNQANQSEVQSQLASYWYKTYYDATTGKARPGVDIDQKTLRGEAATAASQLRSLAAAYGYPAGDDWLEQNTYKVIQGTQNVQDTQDVMKRWAMGQYKGVADRINGGETVEDILDPYKQVAAATLGSDKMAMRPDDPKWNAAISGDIPLTLDQWRVKVRQDKQYGWDTSVNAQAEAYKMAASLRSIFQGE
jgi:hypothetical protein